VGCGRERGMGEARRGWVGVRGEAAWIGGWVGEGGGQGYMGVGARGQVWGMAETALQI
jgi:hypothetical protein